MADLLIPDQPNHYWGKYRGRVIDNDDPLQMGRILADVPALPGRQLIWAMPCMPYLGPNPEFNTIPPIGSGVWIEFEGGNADYPIWVGCFWEEGQMPLIQLSEK